jgi:endo-1,4-beta-D-glucanase Y
MGCSPVARAVLAHEAVHVAGGVLLPAAGPWAVSTSPPTVNPSYLMPGVFDALARMTGDARWSSAARTAVAMMVDMTQDGRRLPPDWSVLSGGRLVPTSQPGGGAGVQYGLDAARAPIWFATACDGRARDLAANWWRAILHVPSRTDAVALTLEGSRIVAGASPVTLLAGAAAARAAGAASAGSLAARAAAEARSAPTYYGDAWTALSAGLSDGSISPCA